MASHRNDLVKPVVRELMIAPTDAERNDYTQYLYVYAKAKVQMPSRLAFLIDKYQVLLVYISQDHYTVLNVDLCTISWAVRCHRRMIPLTLNNNIHTTFLSQPILQVR